MVCNSQQRASQQLLTKGAVCGTLRGVGYALFLVAGQRHVWRAVVAPHTDLVFDSEET